MLQFAIFFLDWRLKLSNEEEKWIVTNIFLRIFENSSDELGTANTRHLRKSIVNNLLIFVTVQ
jgi:hypothetical protein